MSCTGPFPVEYARLDDRFEIHAFASREGYRPDIVVVVDSQAADTLVDIRPHAPHEEEGPLPAHWRWRIDLAPIRCGQPTKSGRPCRNAAKFCRYHRPDKYTRKES